MYSVLRRAKVPVPVQIALFGIGVIAYYLLGGFDPVPENARERGGVFVYYGPEGETVPAPGTDAELFEAAVLALGGADYFGAYATGPDGRTGLWSGARTPALARDYALARCGAGCRIVAERVPLHRDPTRSEPVLTAAMARNLGGEWPFIRDVLAVGGAEAWGHAPAPTRGKRAAKRKAAAECESRRALEEMADTPLSPPCRVLWITEIEDLRPKPRLYPAPYTIALTTIAPASEIRAVRMPDAPKTFFRPYLPPKLHGARAATAEGTAGYIGESGWPEAGEAIALMLCTAMRAPGEGPCVLTHVTRPAQAGAEGVLPVAPDLYEAFEWWTQTKGQGAFAISPYGVWGYSRDMPDLATAKQRAADWCWYYTTRSWRYRQVQRSFNDPGLSCRIIALRED